METTPPPTTKKCSSCRRILPFPCFGVSRHSKYGILDYCKECTSFLGQKRRKNNGFAHPERLKEWPVPMNVGSHNDRILSLALLREQLVFHALHIPSKSHYYVVAGKNHYGVFSVRIGPYGSGAIKLEWINALNNDQEFKRQVLEGLRVNDIRLELNELDLLTALKMVYYF